MRHCGRVAQLVEHRTFNPVVPGSSPGPFTNVYSMFVSFPSSLDFLVNILVNLCHAKNHYCLLP